MDQSTNWNQIFGSNNTYEGMLKILQSQQNQTSRKCSLGTTWILPTTCTEFSVLFVYLNRDWFEFEIIFLIKTDEGRLNRSVESALWYSYSDTPSLRVFCSGFLISLSANVSCYLDKGCKKIKMVENIRCMCKLTTLKVLLFPYLTAKIETQQQIGKDIMTHTLR